MKHLILDSYTGANVIAGTILSYHTDLGSIDQLGNLNLTAIEQQLSAFTIPAGTPQWRIDIATHGTPQFILHVEDMPDVQLVGVAPLHGHHLMV